MPKRSKCNSHKKSRTCPRTKCSWVKGRKNSNGQRVKPHCKGKGSAKKKSRGKKSPKVARKVSKKKSNCVGKKSPQCNRSKKCNWTKAHTNKNGQRVKGFCKSNPVHGKGSPVTTSVTIDDISSSSSSSSSGSHMTMSVHTPVSSAGQLVPGSAVAQGNPAMSGMSQMVQSPQNNLNNLIQLHALSQILNSN